MVRKDKMNISLIVLKKLLGLLLIVLGVIIFLTPFTPGSWIFFVGLELIGVRMAVWERIKEARKAKK